MNGSQKKRKANQDEVIGRICECILADAPPFDGNVETLDDLKKQLQVTELDTEVRKGALTALVEMVNEAWFDRSRANRLLAELSSA
jgi:hypothetical protein